MYQGVGKQNHLHHSFVYVFLSFLFSLCLQVDQFDVYKEYISNYNTAMSTVRKCKASNEQFNKIFSKVCYIVDHVTYWMQSISLIYYFSLSRKGIAWIHKVHFLITRQEVDKLRHWGQLTDVVFFMFLFTRNLESIPFKKWQH